MEFKDRLRSLRKERKLTQGVLAQELNYGYTAISNYESGRNEPSITDLKKIARFFDVSLDYLLCINDIRNPYNEDNSKALFLDGIRSSCEELNNESREELVLFIDWLVEKQNKKKPSVSLGRIAQETEPYTR
ncbi:MAG: helix-turn-helix transcriptional regulator [Clostridiales bacterium]|nr:helix-turn-helix transcriptional regulator [Clostridiales bacterium]